MTKIFLALITLLAASTARADLLIEPYVGYGTGHNGQSTTYTQNGAEFGARVGYQSLGFMLGLDYMSGSVTDKASPSDTITPSDFGVFVGYKFPMFLRVYGEYVPLSDPKVSNSSGTAKPDGTALKAGVQFTGLPMVAIGLEYYKATYSKDKQNNFTYTPNFTSDMISVTVSLPLTF
jgi:hypothetical protein